VIREEAVVSVGGSTRVRSMALSRPTALAAMAAFVDSSGAIVFWLNARLEVQRCVHVGIPDRLVED
jgi:hypothetical protein